MNKTQIKLIEAAELEFAERGFHGTSVREITTRAQANIAAVNYHFSSKEGLFMAMVRYRIEPLNEARLKLLEKELESRGGDPLPLPALVDIIIRPLVEAYHAGSGSRAFMKAMERGMSEEEKFTAEFYTDILAKMISTFRYELGRSLENVPSERVDQCFAYLGSCISGAFQYCPQSEKKKSNLNFPDADLMVAFITGGIEALVSKNRSS